MAGGVFPPSITISRPYDISAGNAKVDGQVLMGSSTTTNSRGLIVSLTNDTNTPFKTINLSGTNGSFSAAAITGLTPGTRYYIFGFVKYTNQNTSGTGTSYSQSRTFVAGDPDSADTVPEVGYVGIDDITETTARLAGYIYDDGGSPIIERGFVYGTSPNPTVANTKVVVPGTSENYFADLSSLSADTVYHVRGFAQNAKGRSYSDDHEFRTQETQPVPVGNWKIKINTALQPGNLSFYVYYVRASNFNIDWGDGSQSNNISGSNSVGHTYATNGIYEITMTGTFTKDLSNPFNGGRVHFGGLDWSDGESKKIIETSVIGGLVGIQSFRGVFARTALTTVPDGLFDQYPDIYDIVEAFRYSAQLQNFLPLFWTHPNAYVDDLYADTNVKDLSAIPEQVGGGGSGNFVEPITITKEAWIEVPFVAYDDPPKVNKFSTLIVRPNVVARFSPIYAHTIQRLVADGALLRAMPSSWDANDNPTYEKQFVLYSENDQTVNSADIKDSKAVGAVWRNVNGKDSGNNLGWVFSADADDPFHGDKGEVADPFITEKVEPAIIETVRIHSAISPFGAVAEYRPIAIEGWEETIESDNKVEVVIDRASALKLLEKNWGGAYSLIISLITDTEIERRQYNFYEPADPADPPSYTSNIYDSYYITSIAPDERTSNYRLVAVGLKGYLQKRLAIPAARNTTNGTITVPDGTVNTKPIPASQILAYTNKSYKGIILNLINETRSLQDIPVYYYTDHSSGDLSGTVQRTYLMKDFMSISEAINNMLDDQGAPSMITFDGGFGDREAVKFFFEAGHKPLDPDTPTPNIYDFFYKGVLTTKLNDQSSNIFTPDVESLSYKVTNNLWSVGNASDGNILLCHKTQGNPAAQVLLQEVNTENADIKTSTYLLNYTMGILQRSGQSVRTMTMKSGFTKEMLMACAGNFVEFTTPTQPEINGTRWRIVHRVINSKSIDFDLAEEI